MAGGHGELDLGLEPGVQGGGPPPITSSRTGHLVDALEQAYRALGFEDVAGGDEYVPPPGPAGDHRAVQQARQPAGNRQGQRTYPAMSTKRE
jgi:hypothetical protein